MEARREAVNGVFENICGEERKLAGKTFDLSTAPTARNLRHAMSSRRLHRTRILVSLLLLLAVSAPLLFGVQSDPTPAAIDEIIRRFAEKEKEFKLARANYTFRQDIRVQELDSRGNPGYDEKGNLFEYRAVTDILFDNKGQRIEKKVEGPTNRLRRFKLTKEDFEDFRSVQPFVLTIDELPQYM